MVLQKFPIEAIETMLRTGDNYHFDAEIVPSFKKGDSVTVVNIHPRGHTRLPAYVRGKTGVVDKDFGVYVFNDAVCHDEGPKPQHLYNVLFTSTELWGKDAPNPRDSLCISMFEDYLVKE